MTDDQTMCGHNPSADASVVPTPDTERIERLAEIRGRAAAAAHDGTMLVSSAGPTFILVPEYDDAIVARVVTEEDAEFVAAAWQDVPYLLDEVARLTGLLAERDATVRRVRDLADRWEHGATRWADPLPIPVEVHQLRAALDSQEPTS